jgi:hypothetical protein
MTEPTATSEDAAQPKTGPSVLESREDIRDAVNALIGLARRDIILFAPQMESFFFNGAQLGQMLASFAARHRNNRARLLVEDAAQVLRDNDRLIGLCRRFAEFIQLRQVGEEHRGLREMFVIVDDVSYMHQPDITEPKCIVEPSGRKYCGDARRRFDLMWDRSEPLSGLNTAGLRS